MSIKKIVTTSLMAAITCVATMIIKIPTPTMGYIHPGDAVVLLCGFLLGPIYGTLAAGIGSMFADLFSGYVNYAPATLIIKAGTAFLAAILFPLLQRIASKKEAHTNTTNKSQNTILPTVISGIVGECFMVLGYFIFEIFLMALSTGDDFSSASLAAGAISSASGIPFNIVQGVFGIIIATLLYPALHKALKEI